MENKEMMVHKVLQYMKQDLTYLKSEATEETDWLLFVAYRIKGMILNASYKKAQTRIKYEKQDKLEDYTELNEMLEFLYDADWIDIDYVQVFRDKNYSSVYACKQDIDDYLGSMSDVLFKHIKSFEFMQSDSSDFANIYKEVEDLMLPLFIEALKIGLDKVDMSKSGREKATYVNKVVLTQYIQLQLKRDGKIRVREGDVSYYVTPKIKDEIDPWFLILKQTFSFVGVEKIQGVLTKKQYDILTSAYEIVEHKLQEKDYDWFRYDKKGNPKLIKRNIANELGISESNYIQTMKRIQERIDNVFVLLFQDYLDNNK